MRTQNFLSGMKNSAINFALETYGTQLSDTVKSRYGFQINIDVAEKAISLANEWLKKYDKKHETRRKDKMTGNIANTSYVFPIDTYTYVSVAAGYKRSQFEMMMAINAGRNESQTRDTDLVIYIFGRYSKKYYLELSKKCDIENNITLNQYEVSGDTSGGDRTVFNSIISDLHSRNIDTLFFDNDVTERIVNHIDNFINNENIYKKKDILYKTGILLYGQPGTGKSSLAKAIATKYKDDLIIVDMTTFSTLNTSMLTQSIDADDKQYIVLLEDVDTLFNSLDRTSENVDKEEKAIINKMLQFLDSNSSPNNVIFIATTNHIEKLDDAIKRAGRFDAKIEVGPICKDTAIKMIRSFDITSQEEINEILSQVDSFPVNQSQLQSVILSFFKEKLKANQKDDNSLFEYLDNVDMREDERKEENTPLTMQDITNSSYAFCCDLTAELINNLSDSRYHSTDKVSKLNDNYQINEMGGAIDPTGKVIIDSDNNIEVSVKFKYNKGLRFENDVISCVGLDDTYEYVNGGQTNEDQN